MKAIVLGAGLFLAGGLVAHSQMKPKAAPAGRKPAPAILYANRAFALMPDKVVQRQFEAKALSATELTSNYRSPAAFKSPVVQFKFAINGRDNENPPGMDHKLVAIPKQPGGTVEPPMIVFGKRYVDETNAPEDVQLAQNQSLHLRVDMRPVLAEIKQKGFFTTWKGDKIYKEDFKKVMVAGSAAPLTWDFDNLDRNTPLQMQDPDGDGVYEITLKLNPPVQEAPVATHWKKSIGTEDFPQYKSPHVLPDALYNLALEEARRAVEPDSTFRTGKEWAGVWTRDISYSIILAQASLQPRVAMKSLMKKVTPDGRIIQDNGTGGSWPCSTDRMVWAAAAWEVYCATGDEAWLRQVYPIIRKSIEADAQVAYDAETGLVRGESSFLDWREQTYPKWMQPADIYQSLNLGTIAVHYRANAVAADMARKLGDAEAEGRFRKQAETIKAGMQKHLWQEKTGQFGQYLYGREHLVASPRYEALGAALSVLWDIANPAQAGKSVGSAPAGLFGIPCIWPHIPGIPPYHNNAVWPFVQSYWGLAAAKAGNEEAFMQSLAAVYRPAALFLTNKENFVAETGDWAGTVINSSVMLWSLSGSIGLVHKGLFGIGLEPDRLTLHPFVPKALTGTRSLTGYRWRGSVLDIELRGHGSKIASITMDGKPMQGATVPATLMGKHAIVITLNGADDSQAKTDIKPSVFTPDVPLVKLSADKGELSWAAVAKAQAYKVLKDGKPVSTGAELRYKVAGPGSYQVLAVDKDGYESFASEPLDVYPDTRVQRVVMSSLFPKSDKAYQGHSGQGFVEISRTVHTTLTLPVTVAEDGEYALSFRYANGNGPVNTDNKCAIRTLRMDGRQLGTFVFPQRGIEEWANWGFTNPVRVKLIKGAHKLDLTFEQADESMNAEVNQAMLDYLQVTRLN